ncbi:MAG: bifunctional 4-hydroxy-2-oxoglutarate aldolase/2-dehydro-3-deoxy-phosphogluconate aldolase [Pirellulaceae bacterium]
MVESRFPQEMLQRIERCGIVAVLVIDELEHAVPLAKSLLEGGVQVMELTLRTPVAIDALKLIRQQVPEILAGIGTILRADQVDAVHDAGGAFGVSPGCNPGVLQRAAEIGLPFAPGIVTPTDIEIALELGCRELKFFPAESSGGLEYLQSMAAPYTHLGTRFLPLGGVSMANLAKYLASPLVLAVGGSWLAPRSTIAKQDWQTISKLARQASETVKQTRGV